MSVRNYQQSVPGVIIREIDDSVVPDVLDFDGPLVFGRSLRGPAMQPITVSSFSEFLEVFGEPTPNSNFNDVWRDNQITGPTYGVLGAQAALYGRKNLTFVRLLGTEHSERTDEGRAGWKVGSNSGLPTGGAYGLFLFASGSAQSTGTLAAVWYLKTGSITLSGTLYGSTTLGTGSAVLIESNSDKAFRALIKDETGAVKENVLFDFAPTSQNFVRKAFNTNASRLNSGLFKPADMKTYFLGETFEDFVSQSDQTSLQGAGKYIGVILALKHNTKEKEHSDKRMEYKNAQTGWFFSQDLNPNYSAFDAKAMTKLFKFHALDSGEWNQNNIKISITNIRVADSLQNPYGTFDVLIRKLRDRDSSLEIIERFANCDLNPQSPNYISRKVGDTYNVFDHTKRLNREYGLYPRQSKYIRVEVSDLVDSNAIQPETLPFGVYGPVRYQSFVIKSGSATFGTYLDPNTVEYPFVRGGTGSAQSAAGSNTVGFGGVIAGGFSGSVIFPSFRLRKDTISGSSNSRNVFFGIYTEDESNRFTSAVKDLTRTLSSEVSSFEASDSDATEYAWVFTLDDVRWFSGSTGYTVNGDAAWEKGSRAAGLSLTSTGSHDYQYILDNGFNSFTSPMFGGFDGWNITEIEPLRNEGLESVTDKTSYAYNSIKRAIDITREKSEVDFNMVSFPGLTNETLTGQILDLASTRKDSVAIIDLAGDYKPRSENSLSESERQGNIVGTVSMLKSRGVNTSYGATYYPWLVARDSISNQILAIPPSIAALGVWSINDKENAEWSAPAGVNRAKLSAGAGGLEIIGVKEKIYSDDQKKLYESNINPILKSTKNGIVIWGQKTLQFNPKNSALSRISVRRAIIALQKAVTRVAESFIFEANIPSSWAKFLSIITPIFDDIKTRFGIVDYKIILDERTTTADLIDRNIIYAKIFVKPTIVAENIFLDFTLTNQSADFANLE